MFCKSKFLYLIPTCTYKATGPAYSGFQNSCIHANKILNPIQKLTYSILNVYKSNRLKVYSNYYYPRGYNSCALHKDSNKLIRVLHVKSIHSTAQCDSIFDRTVPRSTEEIQELLSQHPVSSPDSKLLKIAIIGVPNSGKSTLINQLLGWRVCSVSSKVHTTQCNARAVSNQDETQLVYLDTPGIVTPEEIKKYKLKKALVVDPERSIEQADLIAVLHDVSNSYSHRKLHPRVLRLLLLFHSIPSVLILNKVDLIRKKCVFLEITRTLTDGVIGNEKLNVLTERNLSEEALRELLLNINGPKDSDREEPRTVSEDTVNRSPELEAARDAYDKLNADTKASIDEYERESSEKSLRFEDVASGRIKLTEKEVQKLLEGQKGWPLFREVFMTSALNGDGIENLKDYFISSAKKAPWIFSDDVVTDQSPQEIALMAVREKCLDNIPHNIPYELKFKILNWRMSDADVLTVLVGVYCRRKGHLKVLIGPKGANVKRISQLAEQELRNTFRTDVLLRVSFECDPNVVESDV